MVFQFNTFKNVISVLVNTDHCSPSLQSASKKLKNENSGRYDWVPDFSTGFWALLPETHLSFQAALQHRASSFHVPSIAANETTAQVNHWLLSHSVFETVECDDNCVSLYVKHLLFSWSWSPINYTGNISLFGISHTVNHVHGALLGLESSAWEHGTHVQTVKLKILIRVRS